MTALRDLTEVQAGIETTAGTLVAAERLLPFVEGAYSPMIQRKTLDEVRGVRAEVDDPVVRRGSELTLTQELDFENVLLPLLCSLSSVTRPISGSTPYTWGFVPSRLAPSALNSATFEIAETDGTNRRYSKNFGLATCTALTFTIGEETAQIQTTWMGRAAQTLAAPAAVSEHAREIVPAAAFDVAIDDTWATLGTTLVGRVRSATVTIDPGLAAAYYLAGRADLDLSRFHRGRIVGAVDLLIDHDGAGAGEIGHWEAGDLRAVRLQATGTAGRQITLDLMVRYVETPDLLGTTDAQQTLALTGALRVDATAARNLLAVEVVNTINDWS